MKFRLGSIKGGEESVTEGGLTMVTAGIHSPSIVEHARRAARFGDVIAAEHLLRSWPGITESAITRLLAGDYEVDGDVVVVEAGNDNVC